MKERRNLIRNSGRGDESKREDGLPADGKRLRGHNAVRALIVKSVKLREHTEIRDAGIEEGSAGRESVLTVKKTQWLTVMLVDDCFRFIRWYWGESGLRLGGLFLVRGLE